VARDRAQSSGPLTVRAFADSRSVIWVILL